MNAANPNNPQPGNAIPAAVNGDAHPIRPNGGATVNAYANGSRHKAECSSLGQHMTQGRGKMERCTRLTYNCFMPSKDKNSVWNDLIEAIQNNPKIYLYAILSL